jgi:hypothetical protein
MRKLFWIILMLSCIAGAVFSVVMLIMAARFMEYGRVIFYLTIAIICIEVDVISFLKLKNFPGKNT